MVKKFNKNVIGSEQLLLETLSGIAHYNCLTFNTNKLVWFPDHRLSAYTSCEFSLFNIRRRNARSCASSFNEIIGLEQQQKLCVKQSDLLWLRKSWAKKWILLTNMLILFTCWNRFQQNKLNENINTPPTHPLETNITPGTLSIIYSLWESGYKSYLSCFKPWRRTLFKRLYEQIIIMCLVT